MSIFNSVLGSLSPPPKFRKSFKDPRARDIELPLYNSPPSPRVPAPVTSSVLWTAPQPTISSPPRVPDHLLALQRRAKHLEEQLQELLDAQADGLLGGLGGQDGTPDDLISTGSTTPTVSSVRSSDRSAKNGDHEYNPRKRKISLNAARLGISRRIKQLANVRAEELEMLDEDLRNLQVTVEKIERWSQKRSRLQEKITDIKGKDAGFKTRTLQTEASKLAQEIRQKEEELWALKRRHRRVVDELADTENSVEARISSYNTSLLLLDREVTSFLARPPANHTPLSSLPFLKLHQKRRTLEMAREFWQDEYTRLAEKCEEVNTDRGALNEGADVWGDVVKKVAEYETSLQTYMRQVGRSHAPESSNIFSQMNATILYLEDKLELAEARTWNLLVCAIGAELEAFKQGRDVLEEALGRKGHGKEKLSDSVSLLQGLNGEHKEQITMSAIRISRSPPKIAPPVQQMFDTDDDDPDPELMISHQDLDTN